MKYTCYAKYLSHSSTHFTLFLRFLEPFTKKKKKKSDVQSLKYRFQWARLRSFSPPTNFDCLSVLIFCHLYHCRHLLIEYPCLSSDIFFLLNLLCHILLGTAEQKYALFKISYICRGRMPKIGYRVFIDYFYFIFFFTSSKAIIPLRPE